MNEINRATIQSQTRRLLWYTECITWNENIYNIIVCCTYFSADRLRNGNYNRQFVFKINVTAPFIRAISLVASVPEHRTSEGSWCRGLLYGRWDYETTTCFERARLPPRYNYSVVDLDSMCTVFSAKGWNINPYSTLHIFIPKRSLIY